MALQVADLLVKISGDPRAFEKEMMKTAKAVQQFGQKMKATGRTMTMSMSLPLAGLGGAAVKMSADFDSSLSKIVGLVGLAEDQVASWREEILALGPAVGKGPKELADAMFFITSAGARGATAMNILKASSQAAAAGLGETKDVAFAAVSAVNAYGEANLDAEQAVATLVATVREGNLEAATLAPTLGKVLPIASELGVSFDQLGAAIAAMTRLGLDSATATTSLRQIMTSIQKPTKEAQDALAEMGYSAEQLKTELKEKGLLSLLMNLKDMMGQNAVGVERVFGNVRALTGVLNLVGSNAKKTEEIFSSLAKTTGQDLRKAFETVEDTDLHKINQALAQMQATMIELGAAILPTLVPMIQDFADGVATLGEWLQQLSTREREWLVRLGMIAIALGPVLWSLGATTAALGVLGKAFTGAGTAAMRFGVAVQTSNALANHAAVSLARVGAAGVTAQGMLAGLVGFLTYELTKAFLDSVGFYKWTAKQLGLVAKEPVVEFTNTLAENRKAFEAQLYTYNKMRESVGALGEEWAVASDHSRVNAERLAYLTTKLERLAKETRQAKDDFIVLDGVLRRPKEDAAAQVEKFTNEIKAQTAAIAEQYDLLSKEQVAARLEELAEDYAKLTAEGYNAEQVATAQADEMLRLLDLHKQYGMEAPKSVMDYAKAMSEAGVPVTQEMLEQLGDVGGYVTLAMKNAENLSETMKEAAARGLSGGFGIGAEEGVRFADQKLQEWKDNLGAIPVKFVPDFEELDRMLRDMMSGYVPSEGGSLG